MTTYVIRRSNGTKSYIEEESGAGTATSNRPGKARRFGSRWEAWCYVAQCGVPENWVPVKLVPSKSARPVVRSTPVYTSSTCKNCKRRYRLKWTAPDTGLCRRCG